MAAYERLLRPLLFRVDPEAIHNVAMRAICLGLVRAPRFQDPSLERTLFGVRFPNPIGLAAGFDKDGVALSRWAGLGFGYVELGTVTRHAQPGNPKPRLFRIPERQAILNRMGFNNEGADAMAKRIDGVQAGIPVGINIGKSKLTPLEDAPDDYAYSFRVLKGFADYVAVNVSSPNTPGLRSLQDKEPLLRILGKLKEIDADKPLFVKVAPDLTEQQLDDVLDVARTQKLTGIIATNTTIARDMLPVNPNQEGGLSGPPVKALALKALRHLKAGAWPELVLMGVGGISTAKDVRERLQAGADLCQIYTSWVYGGVGHVPALCRELTHGHGGPVS